MLQKRYKTVIKVFICGFALLQGTNNLFAQQQLTLAESKELALKNNNRIGKAKEDVIATQSDKLIADVAGRPKLDASATAFYFGEPLCCPNMGLRQWSALHSRFILAVRLSTASRWQKPIYR